MKHQYVKKFIEAYVDSLKTKINYKHGTKLWTTEYVRELLSLLNLEPVSTSFTYNKVSEKFNVTCKNHPHSLSFTTSVEKLRKGQICKYCLNTCRKLTQEEAEEKARKVGYILHSQYTDYHGSHKFTCPEGHLIDMIYWQIFKGCCNVCGPDKKRDKLRLPYARLKDLFQYYNNINKDVEVKLFSTETEYNMFKGKNSEFGVKHTCNFCGKEKTSKLREVLQGNLMHKECGNKFINSLRTLTYEEVEERFVKNNLKILISKKQFQDEYQNNKYRIEFHCMICNFSGIKCVADILTSKCPMCRPNFSGKSKGKLQIWAYKVKDLGNNVCFNCGLDSYLEAHHVYDKKSFPHLKLDPNNGKALCYLCHRIGRHSYHRYITSRNLTSSTPYLFQEWLDECGEACKIDTHNYLLGYHNKEIIPLKVLTPFENSSVFTLKV
ncbi:hypothetical protein [Domibacillus indicus]|uniref:hypothetical protein n=1 Tax=Domibacillus indicus TaxID=1437523 RepID=UPI0012E08D45|nr:hypothetical protein [Domibacillus indicus]